MQVACTRIRVIVRRMDTQKQPGATAPTPEKPTEKPQEIGGAKRDTDPARYLDWEINGKCVDF